MIPWLPRRRPPALHLAVAAALLCSCAGDRAAPPGCVVAAPAHLSASVVPTDTALHRLLAVATGDLASVGASADVRILRARLHALDVALDSPSVAAQCRALQNARAAFTALPLGLNAARTRNSVALVLDLAAAWITRPARG